jgi:hypothetical protein
MSKTISIVPDHHYADPSYPIEKFHWLPKDRRLIYKGKMIEAHLPDEFWIMGKDANVRVARHKHHEGHQFTVYTPVQCYVHTHRINGYEDIKDIRVIINWIKDYSG